MQSDQPPFDLSPSQPTPARPAPPPGPAAAYIPRTVWQTPHGLAPTFTRPRSARTTTVSALVRRCLRLTYRLRRMAASRPTAISGGRGGQFPAAA
jgi:hypothetical protein